MLKLILSLLKDLVKALRLIRDKAAGEKLHLYVLHPSTNLTRTIAAPTIFITSYSLIVPDFHMRGRLPTRFDTVMGLGFFSFIKNKPATRLQFVPFMLLQCRTRRTIYGGLLSFQTAILTSKCTVMNACAYHQSRVKH